MRLVAICLLLAGCNPPAETIVAAQEAVAEVVVPVAIAAQEVVEPIAPEPVEAVKPRGVHPDAVALIVRWEVSSPAYYSAKLEGIICPPAASGPTWGIGYDGGHQTPTRIATDWADHAHVDALASTSGVTGQARCKPVARTLAHVRTPLQYAQQVFTEAMLPAYEAQAARTYSNGWDLLPWITQGSLVSLTYNRGTGMSGSTRAEMRTIRDECVPAADPICIANQIRAMTRVWAGTDIEAGMRGRRYDEAALAERIDS